MLITTDAQLEDFCRRAAKSEVLAIDTEFIREKTYRARLCLVQLGIETEQVAVDPFTVRDTAPLKKLFDDVRITKVLHACSQDMEVLLDWVGTLPCPVFDTQIAASYVTDRYQIGYGAMVEEYCRVSLPKTESLTDWSRRPLDQAQITYALDDVKYLPQIWRTMTLQLKELGRTSWVLPEFARVCDPDEYVQDPREAYRKVKKIGHFSRKQLAVAREVAAWREQQASALDRPRRWVMSDELLAEVAKRMPQDEGSLMRIRGASDLSNVDRAKIIRAVRDGLACPPEKAPEIQHHVKPSLDSECVCDIMYALTRMVASKVGISSVMLASRDDLMEYQADPKGSPLSQGWRYEVLGRHLDELLSGMVGLTVKEGKVELL